MHAHVHRLVSVVKMATLLAMYTTEEQLSGVRFFVCVWAKEHNAKDIHKEMFHVSTIDDSTDVETKFHSPHTKEKISQAPQR
jgi:hypothetical protein